MINVFQPSLGAEELAAVKRVFESNWVGKGPLSSQFEEAFASYIEVPGAQVRSISCCTEGLFQSLELLGIGAGDEVVLPTISFTGAGNAVASTGAKPVFCDVHPNTLNATAESVAAALTPNTKAVIILHYGGVPCEMDELKMALANEEIALIEDSACSVASRYKGQACGTFGDFGIWSFDAMKILVTGDGGMIFCSSSELASRAERAIYLGLVSQSGLSAKTRANWWEYELTSFGRRAIINDIGAAIGLEQLAKLPRFIARRRKVHEFYDKAFSSLNWLKPPPAVPAYSESSYYFYWIQTDPELRDRLAIYLRDRDIYTTFRYYPLHWVGLYGSDASLPDAERAASETLCLPIHQGLSDDDLSAVAAAIEGFGKTL